MSPASGNSPLRGVGPEDVDTGGELAPKVNDANKAHLLIEHVAKSHPRELTTIQQLKEAASRTKALSATEVEAATAQQVGTGKKKGGLVKVLHARVHGADRPVDQMWVVVLYQTPSGRNARCAVPYEGFARSIAAYDQGVADGSIREGEDALGADKSAVFESQIERQAATIKRLEAQIEDDGGKGDGDGGGDGDTPPETAEELQARIAELEAQASAATERADAAEAAAKDARAGVEDDTPPVEVDLDAVELPDGNADQLKAGMPFYSDDVVAALVERGKAKATREAAEAEQKRRAGTAADED